MCVVVTRMFFFSFNFSIRLRIVRFVFECKMRTQTEYQSQTIAGPYCFDLTGIHWANFYRRIKIVLENSLTWLEIFYSDFRVGSIDFVCTQCFSFWGYSSEVCFCRLIEYNSLKVKKALRYKFEVILYYFILFYET